MRIARALQTTGVSAALAVALSGAAVSSQMQPIPPDFAIKLEGDLCAAPSIDTAKGVYRRHVPVERTVNARVKLTPTERAKLFALVTDLDFFAYPPDFETRAPFHRMPAPSYVITVTLNGQQHTVRWRDKGTDSVAARRLRQFIDGMHDIFEEMVAVRVLPKPEAGCL